MAEAKTERLLQLVLCLTQSRRHLSKEQLRAAIPDYAATGSTEAFERMFERDKNELREMGVPLETGGDDPAHDDEVGYRIDRTAYALPELHLSAEEVTAVALAARLWSEQGLAGAAARALVKLAADGIDVDPGALPPIEPRLSGGESAFAPLAEAVSQRRRVRFGYRTTGRSTGEERQLEPWGVVSSAGRWYVVGHDVARDGVRVFRLSRIDGAVAVEGPPGAFDVPPDRDLRSLVTDVAGAGPDGAARLRVRRGAGHGLRRRAVRAEPTPDGEWDEAVVAFRDVDALAGEIASYGAAVVVVDPAELREAVVTRLRGAADAADAAVVDGGR